MRSRIAAAILDRGGARRSGKSFRSNLSLLVAASAKPNQRIAHVVYNEPSAIMTMRYVLGVCNSWSPDIVKSVDRQTRVIELMNGTTILIVVVGDRINGLRFDDIRFDSAIFEVALDSRHETWYNEMLRTERKRDGV